jgi:hypothetical protein
MFSTDDEVLFLYNNINAPAAFGWVKFIYGNTGPDVINDYTTNLEPLMKKPQALADYWDSDGTWVEYKEPE